MDNSLDVIIEAGTHFIYKSEVYPRKTTGKVSISWLNKNKEISKNLFIIFTFWAYINYLRTTFLQGGYVNGKIQLPTTNDNLKVIISTYLDTSLVYDQQLVDKDPSLVGFHPGALHIVRLKENCRDSAKEPIPNIQMYSLELEL